MVLIREFAKLDRRTKRSGIRALVYAEARGDYQKPIVTTEVLLPALGIDYAAFQPTFDYLDQHEHSLESWGGQRARITDLGVDMVEADVRVWVGAGQQEGGVAPILEKAYAVARELEWERFRFLLAIHELSDGEPATWVYIEQLDEELADVDIPEQTIFHLANHELIYRPESGTFGITDAGCLLIERQVGILSLLGQSVDLDRSKYSTLLPKLWVQMAQSEPAVEVKAFSHSDDYSSVRLGTQVFDLPGRAAQVIRVLDRAHRSGLLWVPMEVILELLGEGYSRPREAFQPNHLDAYRALVKSNRSGKYRLNI